VHNCRPCAVSSEGSAGLYHMLMLPVGQILVGKISKFSIGLILVIVI